MLKELRMKKVEQLVFGVTTEESINNGELSILTKLTQLLQRELTKTSVSTSTDHSTLDQECQCRELLRCTEIPKSI